jgi:hypothetical protein
VRHWRHSKVSLAVVVFLLSFTALDLLGDAVSYPFCDSDLEESSGSSESADVHVDDCFCCSRCVDCGVSPGLSPVARLAWIDSPNPVSFGLLLPCELYRPPRLS